ncbi:hypothetical protein LJC57_04165 [Parabacteroides sp. OttesenSCG-928-G07]|nr:hypothetical protein [Parabacteroides sp. OttesenSCG-928-G07]
MPDFASADSIMFDHPDSLALLFEAVINPNSLSDKDKADYGYALTYLHNRQRRSLINDTLIHFAVDYYEKHDSPRLFNAYLLAGIQKGWTEGNNAEEESLFQKALQLAIAQNDTTLMRDAYMQLILVSNRTKESLKGIELNKQLLEIVDVDHLHYPILSISVHFSRLNNIMPGAPDSILKYTQMSIDKGVAYPEIKRLQVEALLLAGRNKEALQLLNTLNGEFSDNNMLQSNYITTWFNLNQPDSAKAYIDKAISLVSGTSGYPEETEPILFTMKAFQLLYDKMKGRPVTLFDIGDYNDEIMSKNRNRVKVDRERQFSQNKLSQDNLRLDLERGKLRQNLLLLLVVALIIVTFLIYFYQRKLLVKERSVQQIRKQLQSHILELNENRMVIDKNKQLIQTLNEQLSESEDVKEYMQEQMDDITRLTEDNEKLKKKNETLLTDIHTYSNALQEKDQEISSYERLTDQNRLLQERERFLTSQLVDNIDILRQLRLKPRYIEENQWPEITNIVNLLYDNFLHRLRNDYPSLTEEDLRYCALIKLGFSNSVMAALTAISPSSVTKRKQRIKEKIKQQNPNNLNKEEPLEIYLWTY